MLASKAKYHHASSKNSILFTPLCQDPTAAVGPQSYIEPSSARAPDSGHFATALQLLVGLFPPSHATPVLLTVQLSVFTQLLHPS